MLRIRLVGELRLDLDEGRLEPIASRRGRSLLAWLAYHPGLHPRTRVAAVFWPEVLESSARASLRTTLATLRRDLGEEAAGHVIAGRDRLGVEDGPEVWIDVREIGRLVAEGRDEAALALCGDDFLTDLDDDWVLEERRAHRERVGELLAVVGEAAEHAGDLGAAVRHARRRLELDPVSEDAARTLMRRLARTGDRAAAVAAYEALGRHGDGGAMDGLRRRRNRIRPQGCGRGAPRPFLASHPAWRVRSRSAPHPGKEASPLRRQ
jgi:DNA-binding SARP family transcriptional activator